MQRWCRGAGAGAEVVQRRQQYRRLWRVQVQRFFRGLAVVLIFSSGGAQQGVGAEVQEQMCMCRCAGADVKVLRCRGAEVQSRCRVGAE